MKKTVNILLLSCCFMLTTVAQNAQPDNLWSLEITGKVLNAFENGSACKVELLMDNQVVDSISLRNNKKKFFLVLNKNSQYAIRMSKPGYFPRLVIINTHIPAEKGPDTDTYRFSFETALLPRSQFPQGTEILDFPIASIYYDEKQKDFTHSREYTESLRKDIMAAGRR